MWVLIRKNWQGLYSLCLRQLKESHEWCRQSILASFYKSLIKGKEKRVKLSMMFNKRFISGHWLQRRSSWSAVRNYEWHRCCMTDKSLRQAISWSKSLLQQEKRLMIRGFWLRLFCLSPRSFLRARILVSQEPHWLLVEPMQIRYRFLDRYKLILRPWLACCIWKSMTIKSHTLISMSHLSCFCR